MRSQVLPLVLALKAVTGVAAQVNYDGAKAFRIPTGQDITQIKAVIDKLELPVWKGAAYGVPNPNGKVDLVVPADKLAEFEGLSDGMNVEVLHTDLGASISEENGVQQYAAGKLNIDYYKAYHPYVDHIQYLNDLHALYPNNSEIVVPGESVNGNPITGIHFYGNGGPGKPAVVIHGTVHAREWITTMTVEYLAYNLLSNYTTNAEIKGFVDKFDFFIFPVVNPDGFIYTQTKDRLWRKNRQNSTESTCVGRDINRNWPYKWDTPGGEVAGDAPENLILRKHIDTLAAKQGVHLYIDVHSYSQLFMTPYGYSCSALPTNNDHLQSLAKGTVNAIGAVYGTKYQYGPICTTIYQATGSSVDYVNDVTKATYAFTIELPDTGGHGFILPPSMILPTSLETYQGFRYLFQNI
ncbi:Zn-dependent exopeptidase [Venustampulla echinocandica]|uniref:Zn-dependent exopeptidase n=1 Tax=Venustampulla echinocandica TaxID=2656787 RepID=A0A370TZT8_9HELO|nr:Zn-dependent exopeptidase [Venustampulla echinocandica]RDL41049.1 Zn-dependent exopeptidase [Venustampulla echinocandica]